MRTASGLILPPKARTEFTDDELAAMLPRLAGGASPGNGYVFPFPAVTIKSTAKTALFFTSDAKSPFDITEISVSCTGTAGFLVVELLKCTNAGVGEGSSSVTALATRVIPGAEPRTEVKKGFTESHDPTTYDTEPIRVWECPLPMAPLIWQAPLGREPGSVSTTAATSGSRLGLRLKMSTGEASCRGYVEIEE